MQTYRYGMAWRAAGVTLVVLAAVLPLLIIGEGDRVDVPLALILAATVIAGVWCFAYFARYRVTIGDDGLTVERLFRPAMQLAWREVVSARVTDDEITFTTADERKLAISAHFPGYEAVTDAAARNLPDVAFPSAEERPVAAPELVTDDDRREMHRAKQQAWLRISRRSFYFAILLAVASFAAGAAFERVPVRELPRSLAIVLLYVLAFVRSYGWLMTGLTLLFAVLYAIMAAQEARNVRRFR